MPKSSASPSLNINLLPNEKIEAENNGFLRWALTIGRYVVILTEVFAVGTFLFSIYLSKQKNDLRTNIDRSESTVKYLQDCDPLDQTAFCEDRFVLVQSQVNQFAAIKTSQVKQSLVLDILSTLLPTTMALDSLDINGSLLTLSGSFPTEQELQTMIDNFNHSPEITDLNIIDLTKGTNFKFHAQATINPSIYRGSN